MTHAVTTRALGAPTIAGTWPDAARVVGRRAAEWSHGLPGLLVACCFGRRAVAAWALHVALDTLSHDPGEGAAGQRKWVWLP